jgi:hypothetical protein
MKPEDTTPALPARRPYKAPKLVQLGSVSEVTASGAASTPDVMGKRTVSM